MSKEKLKEEIQSHKNITITNFSSFMDSLIHSEDSKDQKRADLISYWLKDFQQYLTQEKTFDASKIKSYKRGDVVKVNLGFNVGSEQGGLRYAIVLDKDNKHNSKTITIVPLTSRKETKAVYERDIDLGRELYNRLKAKYDSALEDLTARKSVCLTKIENIKDILKTLSSLDTTSPIAETDYGKLTSTFQEMLAEQSQLLVDIEAEEVGLKKIHGELQRMRDGSVAKIEQITTISKQRIFDPKKNSDVLAGIRFSDPAMDKINEKIKELYIF